ncbi:GNAT family N-acetyltransferase [Paenibacillus sp. J2TS4]|uniref:GNAT family N-acetyltransferase n=1 Tax=Paenibacillus sp. J2TS4 TaxID=2807194 RepID=UPI001B10EA78|nr:GNAT family N-acetyltransferase [Paenibacillus sp. J2TS4]GIP30905.1 hypothetical protein J2TS4_01150 [Paenibacillus sp. J2TS4]
MRIKTRPAIEDDAEQLAILNQQFNGGNRRLAAEIVDSMRTCNEIIAVAEIDGQVIGFGCAQSFRSFCYEELLGEITELYVEPSVRRKGVATALITSLEEKLKIRGVTEIKVLTGSRNDRAIRMYERCNYVRDDELLLAKKMDN